MLLIFIELCLYINLNLQIPKASNSILSHKNVLFPSPECLSMKIQLKFSFIFHFLLQRNNANWFCNALANEQPKHGYSLYCGCKPD